MSENVRHIRGVSTGGILRTKSYKYSLIVATINDSSRRRVMHADALFPRCNARIAFATSVKRNAYAPAMRIIGIVSEYRDIGNCIVCNCETWIFLFIPSFPVFVIAWHYGVNVEMKSDSIPLFLGQFSCEFPNPKVKTQWIMIMLVLVISNDFHLLIF